MSNRRIVIVGGGPAGVGAALAARAQDAAAEVLLLTDEACEPYEKPPLSKAVLTGKALPLDALIAGPKGVGGVNVTLKPNVRVRDDRPRGSGRRDRNRRAHPLRRARTRDRLVQPRAADVPGWTRGIYYLRTEAEALALKAHLGAQQIADRDRRRADRA